MMKTTEGKQIHIIGKGVCGQVVIQIKVSKGSKKTHNAWRLARVIRKNIAIEFGSEKRHKLNGEIL